MPRKTRPQAEIDERRRVGCTVQTIREIRGLKLGELAAAAGISHSYLSRIESGDRPLTPPVHAALADALGVRPLSITRPDLYPTEQAS